MMTRDNLMQYLSERYKGMFLRTTEEFDGTQRGIWTTGESSPDSKSGMPLFSYYTDSSSYQFGVHKELVAILDDAGWYAEWYDAGTIMLWQD
jgi:hypothetical protein